MTQTKQQLSRSSSKIFISDAEICDNHNKDVAQGLDMGGDVNDNIPVVDTVEVSREERSPSNYGRLPPLQGQESMWQLSHRRNDLSSMSKDIFFQLEDCNEDPQSSPSLARPRGTSMSAMSELTYTHNDLNDDQSTSTFKQEDRATPSLKKDTNQSIDDIYLPGNKAVSEPFGGMNKKVLQTDLHPSQYSLNLNNSLPTSNQNVSNGYKDEDLFQQYEGDYSEQYTDLIRRSDMKTRQKERNFRHKARNGELDIKDDDDSYYLYENGTTPASDGRGAQLQKESTSLVLVGAPLKGTSRKNIVHNPTAGDTAPGGSLNNVDATRLTYELDGNEIDPRLIPTLDWT